MLRHQTKALLSLALCWRIPVESPSELETLKAFLKESNLKSTGTEFFVEHGGRIYQIELRPRAAPRIVR